MKKEHKRCLKRIVAAALVMLMMSGTVPFQPIAEVFDTAITASAAENLTDITNETVQSAESPFMLYKVSPNGFNIQGIFKGSYIQTTYSDAGYKTAIQVNDGNKNQLTDFAYGKLYEFDGVQIRLTASLVDNGKAVSINYEVHNTTSEKVTVKFGSSADTMIGNNDSALVQFVDNGILMEDNLTGSSTYGAEFRLYPGDGEFTTKWLGRYSYAYDNMFVNGTSNSFNGDSGIAWSWTEDLEPGETVTRSSAPKVIETLEIKDCSLTADLDSDNLSLVVPYKDKANLTQILHYSIDDGNTVDSESLNTNESTTNTFSANVDVSASSLNWQPNTEHTLKLWLTDNDEPAVTSATITYKIFWAKSSEGNSENKKTLKFSTNSGVLFADVKAAENTQYLLPSDYLNGYAFMGWCKNADGTGERYLAGSNYSITQDETLYAVFRKGYTVTFNTNGGTQSEISQGVTEGECAVEPTTPAKIGHTFEGWYTDENCTQRYEFTTPVNSDITLYAKWTLSKYNLNYDTNGASNSIGSKSVTYSEAYGDLPECERDGYEFLGWFTEANGGTQVTSETVYQIDGDSTIYAHWKANKYGITLPKNMEIANGIELTDGKVDCGTEIAIKAVDGYVVVSDVKYEDTTLTADNGVYTLTVGAKDGNVTATTAQRVDAVEPTCETEGNIEYYKGSDNKLYKLENEKYVEISETDIIVAATGHDWNNPTYVWNADNTQVTATRTCKNDLEHVETETANVTSEVTTPATCTAKGETTYTATFTNAAFATQTKTIANIDETGIHTYSERSPEWSWVKNGNTFDVSVKFKCAVCDEYETTDIKPTLTVTESNGIRKFTATVTHDGVQYTSERDEAVKYSITINGTPKRYKYGELVTVTAPAPEDGKYFDGWYEGETKVSGSEVYTLYATRDISIEAKYKETKVEAQPVFVMNVSDREKLNNGKQKVSFTYDWDLPEGYTLVKAAIVRSYVETEPNISTANTNVHYTTLKNARGTYKLNLTLGTANASKTVYVTGYIVYKDKTGTQHEDYTTVLTSVPASN